MRKKHKIYKLSSFNFYFAVLICSPVYENKDLEEMKAAQAAASVEEPKPVQPATPSANAQTGNLTMDELLKAINTPSKGIEEESKNSKWNFAKIS